MMVIMIVLLVMIITVLIMAEPDFTKYDMFLGQHLC